MPFEWVSDWDMLLFRLVPNLSAEVQKDTMKINAKRGLFRLWIILAIPWTMAGLHWSGSYVLQAREFSAARELKPKVEGAPSLIPAAGTWPTVRNSAGKVLAEWDDFWVIGTLVVHSTLIPTKTIPISTIDRKDEVFGPPRSSDADGTVEVMFDDNSVFGKVLGHPISSVDEFNRVNWEAWTRYSDKKSRALHYFLWATLPPLLVFVAGLALIWAFSGFKAAGQQGNQ